MDKPKRGRPPASGESAKSRFETRCTPEQLEQWKLAAAANNETVSGMVTRLMDAEAEAIFKMLAKLRSGN